MNPVITLWSKPSCMQCNMVEKRLSEAEVEYVKEDLTAPENAKQLDYFAGLGYRSAPITEYKGSLVPGFIPAELDDIIDAWKENQA